MKKVPSGIFPLIAVDRNASKPLHRQIYDAYRAAIASGELRAGQRVPSTRVLASELGLSRIPVLNSYSQLLAEGYFESRIGAGTVVSGALPEQVAPPASGVAQPKKPRPGSRALSRRAALLTPPADTPWLLGHGAFSISHVAFEHFPFQVWGSLIARHGRNLTVKSLRYSNAMGSADLRETIATYLRTARGVRCEAEQIMIVSGSQQALEISARVLLDPGDSVWLEQPGYRYARDVFALAGCRLIPVPVDEEGLDVSAGVRLHSKAKAVFVTPSHQYPLGVTLNASRRLQLLDWAQSTGAWIIEDDYDSEYRYESMPIASLQGLDQNSRVIYVGTFSKVLFPSLRLGYLVIPSDLVDAYRALRFRMDLGPPEFLQGVLADFIREGHFGRHLRRMRTIYRERSNALTESLRKELGAAIEVTGAQAGMFIAVSLTKGGNDSELALQAAKQNLLLTPLSPCYIGEASRHGFVLGFGSTSAEEMPRAVRKLQEIIQPN